MSLTCFVSYDTRKDEEVFAYRLQTLAGASGIQVLLPVRRGRTLTAETRSRIDAADLVIAFLTSRSSADVRQELAYAQGRGKPVIALRRRESQPAPVAGVEWIAFDERELGFGEVERKVLGRLHAARSTKDGQTAVLLTLLGLGLLALLASGKRSAA
jgi:hypothetical protein